jgi:hypothetical protein
MAVRKLSISMDVDIADDVVEAAAEAGMSVSAWIAELAEERIKVLGWTKLIDEFEAEHGPFTEEELAKADAELDRAGIIGPGGPRPRS